MKWFGILEESESAENIDPYETDQRYWEMFHYNPEQDMTNHLFSDRCYLSPAQEQMLGSAA